MIKIEQLLESVDLDFEPRWVTKDKINGVRIWEYKPRRNEYGWLVDRTTMVVDYPLLNLSEFDGKDWTECIYEVPRWDNPDGQILKLQEDSYYNVHLDVLKKINELADAVNELKGVK